MGVIEMVRETPAEERPRGDGGIRTGERLFFLAGPGPVGIAAALLCKVFDIQIKMVLVWENSAPQKTLIGAYGNIYTYGKLMKTLLLHLSRNLGNFTTSTRHSDIPFLYLQGDNEGDRATGRLSIARPCRE